MPAETHRVSIPIVSPALRADVEHCLKIIAAIEHPPMIAKILTHLGFPGSRSHPNGLIQTEPRFDPVQLALSPLTPKRRKTPRADEWVRKSPILDRDLGVFDTPQVQIRLLSRTEIGRLKSLFA